MARRRKRELRVTAFQRGGDRSALPALEAACRFYLGSLASTRLLNTLDVRVECRVGRKLDADTKGFTLDPPERMEGYAPRSFTVTLHRDDALGYKLAALAHECVGIKQRAQGDLRVLRTGAVRWRGDDYTGTDWRCWPWLAERFALGDRLYLSLKLAVLDGTLDLGIPWTPTLD